MGIEEERIDFSFMRLNSSSMGAKGISFGSSSKILGFCQCAI